MSDKAEDLEDGEIADSCDSDNEAAAKSVIANEGVIQPRATVPLSDRTYRSTHNVGSSSESSSDEEDEYNTSPIKTKRGRPNFPIPPGYDSSGNHNPGFMQAADVFHKKHGKDVWKKVVLEQDIDNSIRQVNTSDKDLERVNRGVESYDYKKAVETLPEYVKNTRETVDYGDDMFGGDSDDEVEMDDVQDKDDDNADICDIESFGTSSIKLSARHRLGLKVNEETEGVGDAANLCDIETFGTGPSRKRTIKDRISKKKDRLSTEAGDSKHTRDHLSSNDGYEQDSLRTEEDTAGNGERKSVTKRLGTRVAPLRHKANFNLSCKETDSSEDVAMALINALGEPHWQADMFHRIVTTIGVKKSLEMYYMTENVEENGGMLILNGERRRSPGGVYIQLVKTDSATTKDMIHLMFPFQNTRRNKRRKNKKERCGDPDSNTKELPTKAEVLLADSSVAMDTKAAAMDDLDLTENEINIELDFPDN